VARDLLQRFWVDNANCRGVDPTAFFPPRGDNRIAPVVKSVCGRCEVVAECLAYRLLTVSGHEDEGIWGGTHPMQRRELRRTLAVGRRPSLDPENVAALVERVRQHLAPEDTVVMAETG
jgi:WhiB family transcriptional regulator, redox-sensing transcriptional regulator